MKKNIFLFSSVFAVCLTSCGINKRHDISEYIMKLNYQDDYRILHLTDIHLGDKDDFDKHFKFMDLTITEANPNLIVVTGDLFTFASKSTALALFEYLDSHNIPWTVTFGNHDEQCYFSIDWLTSTLNNYGSNCVFKDIQDDDVQGNANFAINLMQGDKVFEQIIVMDSNRYCFNGYFGYDYFKDNQIDWYKKLIEYTKEQNAGTVVPSLMFYHIPVPEINNAWDGVSENDPDSKYKYGEKNEATCPPDFNSGFFDVILEEGSTTGMYFGHDHVNNFIVNYKGVDFVYGIKSTDRVYYDEAMLGGRVITIKNDHSVEYEEIYHTYGEVR